MYKHNEKQMILPHEFFLPFGGKLNPENRWCKMAAIIPWDDIEDRYIENFENTSEGNEALSVRTALGSLIIQIRERFSDEKLMLNLTENPYMQYFIGLHAFIERPPYDSSLLVHFRKRLGKDIINEVNELIAKPDISKKDDNKPGGTKTPESGRTSEKKNTGAENSGKLILDATCVPADIHYPTDIWLLNGVREALEEAIDVLHGPLTGTVKKPRTYRDCARKDYLNIDKKKRLTFKEIRKGIGQQLRYIRRDLEIVKDMAERSFLDLLDKRQYRNLLVSGEIYRQQKEMYEKGSHKIEDRIVSIHMPFVRPIVRGKANADVEFGAKLSISIVNGYTYMEDLRFDAYNEGITLAVSVENYMKRFGCYPQAVVADKIYRNRDNLKYCKDRGIRLSGPPLGRPTSDKELLKEQHRQEREDSGIRNSVEGKFGEAKRTYGLNRIMTRLENTSETVIAMHILVMNLEKRLRVLIAQFFRRLFWATKLVYIADLMTVQ